MSKDWQHGAMEWSLYDDLVRQIASDAQATTVLYDLHNEPLLNPDIFHWIRHMKTTAPASRCILTTNGALLDRFEPSDIETSKVDLLAVSLNAYKRETYEKLNGGLDFDHVVENILRLAEVPALRSRLRVDFVTTEINRAEIREARNAWSRRGVQTFCKPMNNRAGEIDNYNVLHVAAQWGVRHVEGSPLRTMAHRLSAALQPVERTAQR